MHATRNAVNATMEISPGGLVFIRDMIMDIPLVANLEMIRENRQQMIDENLRRQNAKRVQHHYQVGDRFYIVIWNRTKGSRQLEGPFVILRTNTNGTLDFRRTPTVIDNIGIRHCRPYKGL